MNSTLHQLYTYTVFSLRSCVLRRRREENRLNRLGAPNFHIVEFGELVNWPRANVIQMEGSMETSAQLTQNCSKKMTLPPEEEKLLSKVLEEQRKYGPVKRKDLVRVLSSMSDSSEICFQMCRRLWQPHYPQRVRMAVAWLVCHPALPEFQAWVKNIKSSLVNLR